MLSPAREKFRKAHRHKRSGTASRGNRISFGEYGIKVTSAGWVTANQIEAARIAITRAVRRGAKVWIRVFPHHPMTSKPAETRMGKGKGAPDRHIALVKPGHILFEIEGVGRDLAKEAMRLAGHKLAISTRFVERGEHRVD